MHRLAPVFDAYEWSMIVGYLFNSIYVVHTRCCINIVRLLRCDTAGVRLTSMVIVGVWLPRWGIIGELLLRSLACGSPSMASLTMVAPLVLS